MNIGFQSTINYGGVGRYTVELVSSLAKKCNRITLYPTPFSIDNPETLDWWGEIPENLEIRETKGFTKLVGSDYPNFRNHDVIHINYATFGLLAWVNSIQNQTPYVYTIHGSQDIDFSDYSIVERIKQNFLERKVLLPFVAKRGTPVTVSKYAAKRLDEEFNINAQIVYHGINPQRYFDRTSPDLTPLNIPKSANIILFVGRFYPSKRVNELIDAFKKLKEKGDKESVLVLVGGGPERDKISTRAERDERIFFLEDLSDSELASLYAAAKIFALPSTSETFGLVFLEAMISGTPVVYADAGASPEVVKSGGLQAAPNSPNDIANKLEMLLSNPELYKRKSQQASKRAFEFSWDQAAEEYIEIYRKTVEGL